MTDKDKIAGYLVRCFTNEDFDNKDKHKEITAEMPDFDGYLVAKKAVERDRAGHRYSEVLRPCYEEPILTRDQSCHLFRKYNFYKHLAKPYFEQGDLKTAGKLIANCIPIRQQLCASNLRLVVGVVRKYNNASYFEDLVSEAYYLILRAVDYFNWTRGFQFSTYASWVLYKTLTRTLLDFSRYEKCFVSFGEDGDDTVPSHYPDHVEGVDDGDIEQYRKELIEELLCYAGEREANVLIEMYFGKQTLESVGKEMGITKERVRQLKVKGLNSIKQAVESEGILLEVA